MQHSEVVHIPLRDLMPHPRNPRKITQESLNRLCDSIRQNGYWPHRPLSVEPAEDNPGKYYILDGCQRKKALSRLKYKEALCMIYNDLTSDERDEIILRSNIENGEWDVNLLQLEFEQVDFDAIGLKIELPEPPNIASPSLNASANSPGSSDSTEQTEQIKETEQRLAFYYKMMGDYIYPSNNKYQIPTLLPTDQPVHLELPFAPWGAESRSKTDITTYHFYVNDYRFEHLFKDPILLLNSGCKAIVEPNCSIHDQTPVAYALYLIYRKRYLSRYLQECGMQIWVDLNVSPHLQEYNCLGIPDGYNAFFTRGISGYVETMERHLEIAKRISGKDHPNICCYGGGKDIKEWCNKNEIVFINEYMNEKKKNKPE